MTGITNLEVAALRRDAARHLENDTGCISCAEGVEKLVRIIDLLTQAMWDARTELGFDTDGDLTPDAVVAGLGYEGYAKMHVDEAREAREDCERAIDD